MKPCDASSRCGDCVYCIFSSDENPCDICSDAVGEKGEDNFEAQDDG